MRSIKTTTPAANRPEISAINKIWRAESLYIKLFPLYEKIDFGGLPTSVFGCFQNDSRCERRLYQRTRLRASFVFANLLLNRSEEHTSELQSHSFISYAVFCLKK